MAKESTVKKATKHHLKEKGAVYIVKGKGASEQDFIETYHLKPLLRKVAKQYGIGGDVWLSNA